MVPLVRCRLTKTEASRVYLYWIYYETVNQALAFPSSPQTRRCVNFYNTGRSTQRNRSRRWSNCQENEAVRRDKPPGALRPLGLGLQPNRNAVDIFYSVTVWTCVMRREKTEFGETRILFYHYWNNNSFKQRKRNCFAKENKIKCTYCVAQLYICLQRYMYNDTTGYTYV